MTPRESPVARPRPVRLTTRGAVAFLALLAVVLCVLPGDADLFPAEPQTPTTAELMNADAR